MIAQGDFSGARQLADEESIDSGTLLTQRNKVLALLHLHEYAEAYTLCEDIIRKDNAESDYDFQFAGTAQWLCGNYESSVIIWKNALNTKYTDAAGGVEVPLLLLFASYLRKDSTLEKESLALLRKRLRSKRGENWPGPVASYVLGRMTESELDEAISSRVNIKDKQICQAQLYKSVVDFKNDDQHGCVRNLQIIPRLGVASYQRPEYYLAVDMLRQTASSGS